MDDQRSDLAVWELAERPFKLWLQGWFLAMQEHCNANNIEMPAEYAKHLRLMRMAKTLARRMDHKSLLKIPDKAGEVIMEQTPEEENTRPWTIKLEIVDRDYKIDPNVPKKFAGILIEPDQPRAEYQFKVSLGSVYSSVMKVYDGMRYYNPKLMANIMLLINEQNGVYGIVSPDLPNFVYDKFLGVIVEPN